MRKDKDEGGIFRKKKKKERNNRLFSGDTIKVITSKTDEKLVTG